MASTSPPNRFNRFSTNDDDDREKNKTNLSPKPSWGGRLEDSRLVIREPRSNPHPPPPNDSQEDS